jgi:8-oxo-dGTP diphosphatase
LARFFDPLLKLDELFMAVYQPSTNVDSYYSIPIEKFMQFGVSIDCVVFGYMKNTLKVLLIKRGADPYIHRWALPGDLVYPNEDINIAAKRILYDLTHVDSMYLEQTKIYGQVGRHPFGRIITAGFYSLINADNYDPQSSSWADAVYWTDLDNVPDLAFDHNQILHDAIQILRNKIRHQPVGFELLPKKFTLGQLQELYEVLLGEVFDKANFRKRILAMNLLKDLNECQKQVAHRPAKLYSFDIDRYEYLKSKGFSFGL